MLLNTYKHHHTEALYNFITFIYLFQKNLLVEAIMDNCFFLSRYMSLKRRFCAAGILKTLCIRYVSDWQKKLKNILVSIEKEKQKLTLILVI